MSQMRDVWEDLIEVLPGFHRGTVEVVFHDLLEDNTRSMIFDQKKGREFIDKLLRALEGVEDK